LATFPAEGATPRMFCGECGGSYPAQDLARFGNMYVCANCKPGYVQRMREGAQTGGLALSTVRYGGFWIRGLALLLDGLIFGAICIPLYLVLGFSGGVFRMFTPGAQPPLASLLLMEVLSIALAVVYQVWFLTKKGGTPGKLALGLRVVAPDGQYLTTARALGRYFAYFLDSFTLGIGYLIAAFDSEKRALHDHLCNTRVIYR
jgi:uncharacterized RDD family membrane protein YckC